MQAAEILIYSGIFIASYIGVGFFRRWSSRRGILDVPNERSSHTQPTPRGGGLIIVLISLGFYFFYTVFYTQTFWWNYFAGALLVAAVSWLDDLFSISFLWRFLIHIAAATVVLMDFPGFEAENFPLFAPENLKIYGVVLTGLWIVWMTNAFNFMDGIDGIAGLQAVTAGAGWMLAGAILHSPTAAVFGGVLAAASLGFLFFNWHPARIFMGDVGSAFLGYSFGVLPILAFRENPAGVANYRLYLFVGAALVWGFFFDTILTVSRRIFQGEKIWTAHRRHIYQQIIQNGRSHRFAAVFYALLSVIAGGMLIAGLLDYRLMTLIYIFIVFESIILTASPFLFRIVKR